MRAGKLRHQIVIQNMIESHNSYAEVETSWVDYATVYAAIEPIQGREFFAALQVNAETTVRIRIRYLSGVTKKSRVTFEGRIYNIQSIIDADERHREMQLMCSEGVNDG
jgi:SPP1 family predicted phage head-tail adaptor